MTFSTSVFPVDEIMQPPPWVERRAQHYSANQAPHWFTGASDSFMRNALFHFSRTQSMLNISGAGGRSMARRCFCRSVSLQLFLFISFIFVCYRYLPVSELKGKPHQVETPFEVQNASICQVLHFSYYHI